MTRSKETSAVTVARWEMWNLRALFPEAEAADLIALREKRRRYRALEEAALERLAGDGASLLGPGRRFLAEHPELGEGIVVTMHIGPYQFLPEPFLHAGQQPAVLLNEVAHQRFAAPAEAVRRRLGLPGVIDWIPVAESGFVRRMVAALRARRPVLVFLDGNGGLGGSARTLKQGMPYRLPGREIRVRTGLGRLVRRLGCPVHPVVLRWSEGGEVVWRKTESRRWGREADPEAVTRQLFDWGFAEVLATPEQWSFWEMLKASYSCFARSYLDEKAVPPPVRDDARRMLRACLDRAPRRVHVAIWGEVEIWPGEVLADLSSDRFFAAEGLTGEDLTWLRERRPSLEALCARHGRAWVEFHVLRLFLLGLISLRGS
jgi:hypothetical protein